MSREPKRGHVVLIDVETGLPTIQPLYRPANRAPELRTYLPSEMRAWKERTGGTVHFTPDGVALTAGGITRLFKTMAAAIASVA